MNTLLVPNGLVVLHHYVPGADHLQGVASVQADEGVRRHGAGAQQGGAKGGGEHAGTLDQTTVRTQSNLVKLHKRGRMLVASYEAIRFQRLDLFTADFSMLLLRGPLTRMSKRFSCRW